MNFEITTKRLQLIPFDSNEHILFLRINNDPYVRKFMWDDELIDEATALEVISKNDAHFKEDQFGIWKIQLLNSDETIGYSGLWHFFDEPQPQLIYALLEKYTKKGYAKEASAAIINYAFETLNFQYLIAATDEPHTESQNVALNLGMTFLEKRVENDKPTLFYKIEK